jgi:hypothetical protein
MHHRCHITFFIAGDSCYAKRDQWRMRAGKRRADDPGSDLRPVQCRDSYRRYRERPMVLAMQGSERRQHGIVLGVARAVFAAPANPDIDHFAAIAGYIGLCAAGNLRRDRDGRVERRESVYRHDPVHGALLR